GSGNIAASLATYIENCSIDAVDISRDALEIAGENVRRNGVGDKVYFAECDALIPHPAFPHDRYDLIVSNPPYVSNEEFTLLPTDVREFEPRIATCDEADGLTFFRALTEIGRKFLASGGSMMAEMAYNQSEPVGSMFRTAGLTEVEFVHDY